MKLKVKVLSKDSLLQVNLFIEDMTKHLTDNISKERSKIHWMDSVKEVLKGNKNYSNFKFAVQHTYPIFNTATFEELLLDGFCSTVNACRAVYNKDVIPVNEIPGYISHTHEPE